MKQKFLKMRTLRGYGPRSEKPASMRDEFDLERLAKAEAKRARKAKRNA